MFQNKWVRGNTLKNKIKTHKWVFGRNEVDVVPPQYSTTFYSFIFSFIITQNNEYDLLMSSSAKQLYSYIQQEQLANKSSSLRAQRALRNVGNTSLTSNTLIAHQ